MGRGREGRRGDGEEMWMARRSGGDGERIGRRWEVDEEGRVRKLRGDKR